MPRPSQTKAINDPISFFCDEDACTGDFVFATPNLDEAGVYAFKCRDPHRLDENGEPLEYLLSVHSLKNVNGKTLQIAVFQDREEFLSHSAKLSPTIFQLPQSHAFEEVMCFEKGTGEYISRQPVDLAGCTPIPITLDALMQRGVQVFFTSKDMAKNWPEEVDTIMDNLVEIPKDTPLSTREKMESKDFLHQLAQRVRQGTLSHYNHERDLCPIDLETACFPSGMQPTSFTQKVAVHTPQTHAK